MPRRPKQDPGVPLRRGAAEPTYEARLRDLGAEIDQQAAGGGGRHSRSKKGGRARRRWSRRRRLATTLSVLLALIVIAGGAGYGYVRYRFDQLSKVDVGALDSVASGQPFNLLVIGSDSRVGLTKAQAAQAGSAAEVSGQRSDVVMIWHVVPSTRHITIMSIPRDTLVSMDGDQSALGKFNRINASFNSGANLLVKTIEDNFGIPINHLMEVDFGGFEGAVNALGGVWMDFPYPAKDAYSGLDITHAGCQLLDGTQALAVARSRHYYYDQDGEWLYDGTSDFGRIQRQDAFLRALIDAAKSKVNPLTVNAFVGSLPQGIVIDNSFSVTSLIGLAEDFRSISGSSLVTYTFPTQSIGYVSPWGDVLFADQPAAQEMLESIFGSQLTTPTTPPPNTALVPTPPPSLSSDTAATTGSSIAAQLTATLAPDTPPSFDPTPCSPK